jgi:4-amino-4-deoxy-L-arabinose transferase-like glycosyltransferase
MRQSSTTGAVSGRAAVPSPRPDAPGSRPVGALAALTPGRLLAATVVLGATLRFATLGTQSLWPDEGFTAKIASHSLASAVSQVAHTESTPPVYYALAWIWAHLFGSSAFALRSLSALFGTATVWAVYWAAGALTTRRVALLAALITAVSPIMVWYSQEARAYALMVLLTVVALGFFVRALAQPRARWLIGWAVCSGAALATHYFAVFPLAVEAVWLLIALRGRRDLLAVLAIPLIVGVALIPLMLYQKAHVPRPWTSAFTVADQLKAIAQSFLVGITWTSLTHRAGVAVLGLLVVIAVVALARGGRPEERRAGLLLAGLAIVSAGVPVLVSLLGTNYLAPRNVLYAWPMLALLVALGAGRRSAGRVTAAALAAGCAVSVAIVVAVPLTPALQRADWRDLLAPLRSTAPSKGLVVVDGFDNSPVIEYYLPAVRAPAPGARVREVDVIGTREQLPAAAPVPGLTPAGVEVRGDLALSRFVAPAPVAFPSVAPPGEAVLVQR